MLAKAATLLGLASAQFRPLSDADVGLNNPGEGPDDLPMMGGGGLRNLGGPTCGNPQVEPNGDLFGGLPDRTLLDFEPPEPFVHDYNKFANGPHGDGFRVVGGADARPHSWPWQVRVRTCSKWRCTYLCGGSIINERWIVTAAHCIPYRADRGNITVGAHMLFDDGRHSNTAQNYTIEKIVNHEGWNRYIRWNDITLVKVNQDIQFNAHVQPICMPDAGACMNPGTACAVTGWGYTSENGPLSRELQEVAVRVIDHTTCKSALWYSTAVYPTQVCAGYVEGGKDSCAGDSGGPLVCKSGKNGPWFLYGVVSWGYGCARKKKPGVYTRVSSFIEWIEKKIKSDSAPNVEKLNSNVNRCMKCEDHEPGQCDSSTTPWLESEGESAPTRAPEVATTAKATTKATTTTRKPVGTCGGNIDHGTGKLHTPNYPNRYDKNQKCSWTIDGGKDAWVQVRVDKNELDKNLRCWSRGDRLSLTCGKRKEMYCYNWDAKRTGLFQCKGEVTVDFSSDATNEGSGSMLSYKIIKSPKLNSCNQLQKRVYNPASDMKDDRISVWPLPKNSNCRYELEVQKGKRAMLSLNRAKTFLSGREKYNRKKRKWVALTCYDKLHIYQGDGVTKIATVCGKRSLKNNYRFMSASHKLVFEVETDGRGSKKERLEAYYSQI